MSSTVSATTSRVIVDPVKKQQNKAQQKQIDKINDRYIPAAHIEDIINNLEFTARNKSRANWLGKDLSRFITLIIPIKEGIRSHQQTKKIEEIKNKISSGIIPKACFVKEYLTLSGARRSTEKRLNRLENQLDVENQWNINDGSTSIETVSSDQSNRSSTQPKHTVYEAPFFVPRARKHLKWLPDRAVKLTVLTSNKEEAQALAERSRFQLNALDEDE